ncbi:MAG TPA: type 2 lanthipeptide synthetase LanM family protein, partial [Actinospica sp.]|nr:type 2 lanthipeptide synthetase LanM family protein [Actinospica sp.]
MTQQQRTESIPEAGREFRPDWWRPALTERERRAPQAAPGGAAVRRPDWTGYVERAVAAAPPLDAVPATDGRLEAFAVVLRAFTEPVAEQLAEHAARLLGGAVDAGAVAATYTAALGTRLAGIGTRTLMQELAEARASGLLEGADGRERFADFLRRQGSPAGLAALMQRYPVLARLLGATALAATEAGIELIARLAADRAALVDALLDGVDPGPVTAIAPGLGDAHGRGRSVALVRFADGRSVVYKPRGVDLHARFDRILGWLNTRIPSCGLYSPALLPRAGYGWMEFVAARPLERAADAHRFYQREGVLLAALYAVHAVDMHCENVVASGDQPVLIDLETLFHPTLPTPDVASADPAAEALIDSVQRTGLLPRLTIGEAGVSDRSGMGGDPGEGWDEVLDWDSPGSDRARLIRRQVPFAGAANRPRFAGRVLEPADYAGDLLDGFRLGYDAVLRDRGGFVLLVESCARLETRVVVRPSGSYHRILDESTSPELLRDARDRDAAFDVLDEASAGHLLWRRLAPHERAALWHGDIPLITSRVGDRDLWTCTGAFLPGLLERSGLVCALTKTAGMGEVDQSAQEWVIAASLATRRPARGHRVSPLVPTTGTPEVAEPGRLLAAASGLADEIVARARRLKAEHGPARVNWLGLQLVEDSRWMVLPMGAGLGDGYLGVALFLAQLAELTGIARYAEMAREAVNPVPDLWAAIADRPDLLAAVGCGGTEGLGGMAYGLARLAALLDDREVRDWAETAVALADSAAGLAADPWWATGQAGCLAAMNAVRALASEPAATRAASVAAACAERLVKLVERTAGSCDAGAEPGAETEAESASGLGSDHEHRGFGTGSAGVGWALARHADLTGDPAARRAAESALRHATARASAHSATEPGWCRGTAGLLLAQAALPGRFAGDGLEAAVNALADRPVLADLSP